MKEAMMVIMEVGDVLPWQHRGELDSRVVKHAMEKDVGEHGRKDCLVKWEREGGQDNAHVENQELGGVHGAWWGEGERDMCVRVRTK